MWSWIPIVAVMFGLGSQPAPDFSGRWHFDEAASVKAAGGGPARPLVAVFGNECAITQTADTLSIDIVAGDLKLEVMYRLDGTATRNMSPGPPGQADIPIVSTARWDGRVLHITTRSESLLDGVRVPVESLRKMWLTAEGYLAIERQGTPARVVSSGGGLYRRVR